MFFDSYEVFDPGVDRPLHEVSREEARRHFEHHVSSLEGRIGELQRLVKPSGIVLDYGDESLERLDEWFPEVINRHGIENDWPTPKALSICNDLGMYLGEVLRRHGAGLHWRLHVAGRTNVAYQRPIVAGFTKVKHPNSYGVDYDLLLGGYAVRLAQGGEREPGLIPRIVRAQLPFI